MPVTIKKGEFNYKDPDTDDYVGVDAISERTTAEMLAFINESLPPDYTALSDKVDALESSLSAFIGVSQSKNIEFNYTTKVLSIPSGIFVFRNDHAHGYEGQTINLTDALTTNNACVLWLNSSYQVYGKTWGAAPDNATDRFVGYIYEYEMYIVGVQQRHVKVIDSSGNLLNADLPQGGSFIALDSNGLVSYNVTTKVLTISQAFSVYRGVGQANSGYTLDVSSISTACILFMKKDRSIYATTWSQGSPSSKEDDAIGYIYGNEVVIKGVPDELIKVVNDNALLPLGLKSSAAMIGINHSVNVVYNYTTKELTIPVGFAIYRGRGIARVSATVLDLSNILADNACKLFLTSSGTIYATAWTGCRCPSQLDQLVGYIYSKNVVIFGVQESRISIIENTGGDNVFCFGDSITAGTGSNNLYHMIWHSWRPELTFYNWGVGSTGYTVETSSTVNVGGGIIGVGPVQQQSGNNTVIKVMQSVEGDMPNIVIAAGTNDYGAATAIATFRTAVQNVLDYALTKTAHILVLTPIKRQGWDSNTNGLGLHLKDYADVIIEECEARGITYANGYDVSINPSNASSKTAYAPDGLHPNAAGHARLARSYFNKMLESIGK